MLSGSRDPRLRGLAREVAIGTPLDQTSVAGGDVDDLARRARRQVFGIDEDGDFRITHDQDLPHF